MRQQAGGAESAHARRGMASSLILTLTLTLTLSLTLTLTPTPNPNPNQASSLMHIGRSEGMAYATQGLNTRLAEPTQVCYSSHA